MQPDSAEPFGHDIWSDSGTGYSFVPDPGLNDYQWIQTSNLGNQPYMMCGEIFGVAVKNSYPFVDNDRIGFFAYSDNPSQAPMWKFYANGRFTPGEDYGWWSREYTFDFRVIVSSNGWVDFEGFSQLYLVQDTNPVEVEAIVVGPGPEPIYDVRVHYKSLSEMNWNESSMEFIGNHKYQGEIPGYPPGSTIYYYYDATDTTHTNECGFYAKTSTFYYFTPYLSAYTLVIFNGFSETTGFPQDYYFSKEVLDGVYYFSNDRWAYGPVTLDLLENYKYVIEITAQDPEYSTSDVVKQWLGENPDRNYFLAGQNVLHLPANGNTYESGEFEYDVLGITKPYFDVSYNSSGDELLPSRLLPGGGTLFGQPLLTLFNSLNPPADSMMYNPNFVLGYPNWIDAFDVQSDVIVDLNVETRSLNGVPSNELKPTVIHRTLAAGNKIVFASLDPLAVTTAVDFTYPYYYWVGFDSSNVVFQTLRWFGIDLYTDVEDDAKDLTFKNFYLSQNYPNPFNPSTTINYQLPVKSNVTIKIYDILGSEVATLVNEEKPAGNYEVNFNASKLSSGVYFYRLQAGSFIETKKMVILK